MVIGAWRDIAGVFPEIQLIHRIDPKLCSNHSPTLGPAVYSSVNGQQRTFRNHRIVAVKRKDHVLIQCLFQGADAIPSFCAQMLSDMHVAPVVDMAVEKGDDHVQFLGLLDLVLLDGLRMGEAASDFLHAVLFLCGLYCTQYVVHSPITMLSGHFPACSCAI